MCNAVLLAGMPRGRSAHCMHVLQLGVFKKPPAHSIRTAICKASLRAVGPCTIPALGACHHCMSLLRESSRLLLQGQE